MTQHPDYTWVQLSATVPGRLEIQQSVVVEFRPKRTAVLQQECYALTGTGAGTQSVTRLLTGARNEVPLVRGAVAETRPGIRC